MKLSNHGDDLGMHWAVMWLCTCAGFAALASDLRPILKVVAFFAFFPFAGLLVGLTYFLISGWGSSVEWEDN